MWDSAKSCQGQRLTHLLEHDQGDDRRGREERRDDDHHDADRNAPVEPRERGDPAAAEREVGQCRPAPGTAPCARLYACWASHCWDSPGGQSTVSRAR